MVRRDGRHGRAYQTCDSKTENAGSDRLLLTIREAAERLAVGRTTAYELAARGELEVVHIGRCSRIPLDALEAFVERRRATPVTKR
jgi:excisionase family DNA binding protein